MEASVEWRWWALAVAGVAEQRGRQRWVTTWGLTRTAAASCSRRKKAEEAEKVLKQAAEDDDDVVCLSNIKHQGLHNQLNC